VKLSPALDRIPPQQLEAEQAVLGGCVLDPSGETVRLVRKVLRYDDFYRASHQRIMQVLYRMEEAGEVIEMLTLVAELERIGATDFCGGRDYLLACTKQVGSRHSVPRYARLVQDAALYRRLVDAGGDIIRMAQSQEFAPGRLIEEAGGIVRKAASRWFDGHRSRLETFTAEELQRMEFEPLRWAVKDLIPEGLTLLVGRSKVGKSFLIHAVAGAVATGGKVLSHIDVEQGDVLYLALEDPKRRLRDRHERLMLDGKWPRALTFTSRAPTLDEGVLGDIDLWLEQHPGARLVIIDTLARVRGDVAENGNVYWSDSHAIAKIQTLAIDRRVAIVLAHHANKMQAPVDAMDSISGSTGIQGPADALILLQRVRGDSDATLHVTGREIKDAKYSISWSDTGGWSWVGDAEVIAHTEAEQEIANILRLAHFDAERQGWMTPSEVAGAFKPAKNRGTIGTHLKRMAEKGNILRDDKTGRYCVSTNLSLSTAEGLSTGVYEPQTANGSSGA